MDDEPRKNKKEIHSEKAETEDKLYVGGGATNAVVLITGWDTTTAIAASKQPN